MCARVAKAITLPFDPVSKVSIACVSNNAPKDKHMPTASMFELHQRVTVANSRTVGAEHANGYNLDDFLGRKIR